MSDDDKNSMDPATRIDSLEALARAIDWSKTPLGPVEAWPTSLKTMTRVMLGGLFPMLIAWGPELRVIFNDGYRPIMGDTHATALGASARVVWKDIWPYVGPIAEGVLAGGPSVWADRFSLIVNRKGYAEEVCFMFSYSSVPDDDGKVGGILITCYEVTGQVQDDRQLHMLRDLAARTADAKTAEEACQVASAVLGANNADVPFSLLYLVGDEAGEARLAASSGFDAYRGEGRPERIALNAEAGSSWPLAEALASDLLVEDVRARFGELPRGQCKESPERAIVLPLSRAGETRPYGFLVAGLSPHRLLDDRYRGLFRLTANQLARAISNARAHEEQRRRAEALAQLDRAKTAFFSNISHEIRTPLTLMLSPVEDALSATEGDTVFLRREQMTMLQRNGMRLLKLVNALLDYSRLEAGRMQATYVPTDLAELTANVVSQFRSAITRAGLRLVTALEPLPEPIFIDREMWEQIVLNLVSNALKFTFEGQIEVRVSWREGRVALVVRDTGVGVPKHELPRLFERFHRVEGTRSRTHEGAGIGLALVYELVQLHGGAVMVESQVGVGTTFTVSIPAGSAHLPRERIGTPRPISGPSALSTPYVQEAIWWTSQPPQERAGGAAHREEAGHVLVADDNADLRDYMRGLLGEHWSVEVAPDGVAAFEAARARRPDVIVADVMMPRLDGLGLLRTLRAEPALQSVPVILLSARAGEESRVDGLISGADDYLVKPFSTRELIARVRTQMTLSYARRRLEQRHAELFKLFEQLPAAICVLRGEALVTEMANPLYRRVVGRNVIGKPLLEVLPELRGQGWDELLRRVMRTGEPFVAKEMLVRYDPDGGGGAPQDTYWTCGAVPLRNADGLAESVLVYGHAVTDHVRARAELEHAREEADQANRAKDKFLAMVSHELRNPLAPILFAVGRMRDLGDAPVAQERDTIERQTRHMARLINDLLDMAGIERGKLQLDKRQVELSTIIHRAVEEAAPLIESQKHQLTLDLPHEGLLIDGDELRLTQVFANLLINAAKYTNMGGHLRVTAARTDRGIEVRVRDNGIGIPPELLPHLFEEYVQAEQGRQRRNGGLGLGLALVRRLVTLHGGTVEARSEGADRGSEFTVVLPPPAEAKPASSARAPQRPLLRGERGRVLVVEDNFDLARMMATMLSDEGYEVALAKDGGEAFVLAYSFQPEVALVDLGLPVVDGYELAQRLRDLPERPYMVALTGYAQEDDRRRSVDAGFAVHLVKPVDVEQLRDAVAHGMAAMRVRGPDPS